MNAQLSSDPYDGTIASASNPLYGQEAWCTPQTSWLNAVAALDEFAGQTVQFRYRLGTGATLATRAGTWTTLSSSRACPRPPSARTAACPPCRERPSPTPLCWRTRAPRTDSFALAVTGGTWPTTLVDSSPITLTAGATATLSVVVEVPESLAGLSDGFVLSATSLGIPGITVQALGETSLDLQAAAAISADQSGGGQPGQVAEYVFTVTNMGSYTDTFTLAITGTWLSTLPDGSTTGPLGAGESLTVTLLVAIPTNALVGDSDVTVLTVTSTLDGSVSVSASAATAVYFRNYLPVVGK